MQELYSTEEAAKAIGIAPETLRYYAWRYQHGIKVGGALVFSSRDIALIRDRRQAKQDRKQEKIQ